MSFFNRYKIKNGNVSDVQDLVAKKWMDGFNSINFSSTSGKEKNTNVKALQDDSEAISVLTSINTASQSIPLYTAQNYNVPKSINVVYVDKAGAATRAYNKVLGTSTDTITPGTTAATGYTWYGLKKYIEGLDNTLSATKTSTDTYAVSVISSITQTDGKIASVTSTDVDKAGAASAVATASKIELKESTNSSYAKVYTIKQGGSQVGTINIPKDLVVSEGSVVTNPTGQPAGTYIKLIIANQTNPLYINVASLIEYVTSGSAAGDMVYVTVDPDTHKVTATITNGTITKEKLDSKVQNSLGLADSAVQPKDTILIEHGGTGATDIETARKNLGLGDAAIKNITTSIAENDDGLVTSGNIYIITHNLDTRISNFENNLGSVLCNQRYHQADVTAAWDNGTISTAIANQSFENIQLGNYITKTLSLPILNGHIDAENGTSTDYGCQIKFVDANAFYGYNNYAVTATPHMAALILGLPNDYMNPTHSTTTAANTGTGYTGYAGSYMHVKYLPAVVKALNNALGNGHLVAHNMLMGTAVGSSLVNRFGSAGGATSSWAWQNNQYITLMTEAQIYGGTIWSSSGYDTGQANTKLAAFNLVRWNKFCGNRYMWLRDVASRSYFCAAPNHGHADYLGAATSYYVVPLILLK